MTATLRRISSTMRCAGVSSRSRTRKRRIRRTAAKLLARCGFIPHDDEHFASPDALIGTIDAVAEFKCPTSTTHVSWILAGEIPDQHKPQNFRATGMRATALVLFDFLACQRIGNCSSSSGSRSAEIDAVEEQRQFLRELDGNVRPDCR